MPAVGETLTNVKPCDCGSRTRLVKGHGVQVVGGVDLQCPSCGALSVMRPQAVEAARLMEAP